MSLMSSLLGLNRSKTEVEKVNCDCDAWHKQSKEAYTDTLVRIARHMYGPGRTVVLVMKYDWPWWCGDTLSPGSK